MYLDFFDGAQIPLIEHWSATHPSVESRQEKQLKRRKFSIDLSSGYKITLGVALLYSVEIVSNLPSMSGVIAHF